MGSRNHISFRNCAENVMTSVIAELGYLATAGRPSLPKEFFRFRDTNSAFRSRVPSEINKSLASSKITEFVLYFFVPPRRSQQALTVLTGRRGVRQGSDSVHLPRRE